MAEQAQTSRNPTTKTYERILKGISDLNRIESEGKDDARLKPLIVNKVEIRVDDSYLAVLLALVKERKKVREKRRS